MELEVHNIPNPPWGDGADNADVCDALQVNEGRSVEPEVVIGEVERAVDHLEVWVDDGLTFALYLLHDRLGRVGTEALQRQLRHEVRPLVDGGEHHAGVLVLLVHDQPRPILVHRPLTAVLQKFPTS